MAGPSTTKAPLTPAPATTATPAQPAAPSHTSTAATVVPSTPSPAGVATSTATETPTRLNDPSALTFGAERAEAIANLESMGFPRSEIDIAMRAAYYNPERAVEYLMDVRT
jgi:UV excision repair protein RAD23